MPKKLLVFSLIALFLLGLMAFARVGDVIKKPGEKEQNSARLKKQRYVHPRVSKIAVPDSRTAPISVKKLGKPVEKITTAAPIDPEGIVIPASVKRAKKPGLIKKHGYLYPGDNQIVPLEKTTDALPHGYLFNYDDESTEYYLGGGTAGDEFGIWFQSPQAACSLYAVEFIFYAPEGGGTIELDVMSVGSVSPDMIPHTGSIAVESIFGANLMGGTFPLEIVATSDWEIFVFPDRGYNIDVGRDIFWIHWMKTGDSPMLEADSDNPGDYLHTWSYEPVQDGDSEWSHYGAESDGIEAMVRCEVVFYEDPPPTVTAKQMNDTYRTDAITLTASAADNALVPELQGIASGKLYYSLNGSDYVEVTAVVSGNNDDGWILSADVPAGVSGDVYEYYFDALDLAGLYGRSLGPSFERTEPKSPDADVLIIADSESGYQAYYDLYCSVLDANNFVYEFWSVDDHKGIDASVVGFGWSNIIVYGYGTKTVPVVATETDPGYGTFLDAGGNLLLVDQDWFYGHGLPDAPTFAAGDFAYDYFGIVSGTNDPYVMVGTSKVSTADTVFYGQDVTPMDSPFTLALGGMTLNHNMYGTTNWGDYFDAANATVIFKGAEDGFTYGCAKEGANYMAVYLSFMVDAAVDTKAEGDVTYDAFAAFFNGVIEYFGAMSPPIVNLIGEGSTRYGVASGTTSGVVNADVIDDGTITVVAKWIVDNVTEESTPMTLVEGSHYTATITPTGFTDTSWVVLWAEATDNDGLTTASPSTFDWWGTDFTPTAGYKVLFMFDYYRPEWTLGPEYALNEMGTNLYWTVYYYDYWDVWSNYQADYATVLSNYDHVIYAGVLDWWMNPEGSAEHTLTEFVDGGGHLLYSSEEVLGTYTDWEDIYFEPGHFAYDVLGVEWVGNDYNYATVAVYDDGGTGLITDLSTDLIALDVNSYYYGSMADLCDPVGTWDAEDMLPSPFIADYTGAGDFGYASSINGNVVFMAFNVSMLPTDQQKILYGNFVSWVSGIEDDYVSLPKAFALSQNYPNPFNPTTNIEFAVPEAANIQIVVYNLLGQRVAELTNEAYQPGHYHVMWNGKDISGNDVSSGIYLYRMTAGNFSKTSKMIFLK